MNEDHEVKIAGLLDNLLIRLDFDIKNQPPTHLPAIANAVVILNGFRVGMIKGDEKHHYEINMINNINKQIKSFGKEGGENGEAPKPTG